MFKKIRAKLPDWRFIAFAVSNSIPGKKLLGDWRFPPIFFTAGFLFEIVLCKLRINNVNFCMLSICSKRRNLFFSILDDVYKRKQAQHFVLKKHQLEDYLKTVTSESITLSTSTNSAKI